MDGHPGLSGGWTEPRLQVGSPSSPSSGPRRHAIDECEADEGRIGTDGGDRGRLGRRGRGRRRPFLGAAEADRAAVVGSRGVPPSRSASGAGPRPGAPRSCREGGQESQRRGQGCSPAISGVIMPLRSAGTGPTQDRDHVTARPPPFIPTCVPTALPVALVITDGVRGRADGPTANDLFTRCLKHCHAPRLRYLAQPQLQAGPRSHPAAWTRRRAPTDSSVTDRAHRLP